MSSIASSMKHGKYVPDNKVLNKKIPENPRYKHVKPAVDSGLKYRKYTVSELLEKRKESQHRKNEIFKRIKSSTFIKLAIAVAEDMLHAESLKIYRDSSPDDDRRNEDCELAERQTFANVLKGIGELDIKKDKSVKESASDKSKCFPYLLLDVRDKEAFSQGHIITALNFPAAMLARTIGGELEVMQYFKKTPNTMIILYDDEETTATRVAKTLVERGYDNVYLLSGGLKCALNICPRGLVTSDPTISVSSVSIFSQGERNVQRAVPKEYFSQADIEMLQDYLDDYPIKYCMDKTSASSIGFSRSRSDMSSLYPGKPVSYWDSSISRRRYSSASLCPDVQPESINSRINQRRFSCTKIEAKVEGKSGQKNPWR